MDILPINAILYNQDKVKLKDVIAPPYDVLDLKYQDDLYKRSEYNIVRLILSKSENKYEDAKNNFHKWLEEGVLIKSNHPCIFYIVQKYVNEKGKQIERKGFIARNRIEDFSTGKILPHEYTMGGPKEDRLKLVDATKAFFSQIFMVYNDEQQVIENKVFTKYLNTTPFMQLTDDNGVENIVYIIEDVEDIKIIQQVMKDKVLLIADGHHRYETSMNFSKMYPENEYAKFVMSYFTNAADENLIIYPTHRIIEKNIDTEKLLKNLQEYYDVEIEISKEDFLYKIAEESRVQITTGLILKDDNKYYILKLKKDVEKQIECPEELQRLDLTVLHELVLKKLLDFSQEDLMSQNGIKYEKSENVAFSSVKSYASACFIMANPKMQDVLSVSSAGLRMPQKSTFFYPKLLSGIVINPLE
jgi:uncharacterized protein (DUF1015 family)